MTVKAKGINDSLEEGVVEMIFCTIIGERINMEIVECDRALLNEQTPKE